MQCEENKHSTTPLHLPIRRDGLGGGGGGDVRSDVSSFIEFLTREHFPATLRVLGLSYPHTHTHREPHRPRGSGKGRKTRTTLQGLTAYRVTQSERNRPSANCALLIHDFRPRVEFPRFHNCVTYRRWHTISANVRICR